MICFPLKNNKKTEPLGSRPRLLEKKTSGLPEVFYQAGDGNRSWGNGSRIPSKIRRFEAFASPRITLGTRSGTQLEHSNWWWENDFERGLFYWKFDFLLKYDFVWYHCVLKGFFGTQWLKKPYFSRVSRCIGDGKGTIHLEIYQWLYKTFIV